MRLVCPKCEAKYEVPDDAIPEGGRDVQCANCNHAWFQMRPVAAGPTPVLTPVTEVAKAAPVAQIPEPEPEPEPEAEPEITPEDLPEDLPEEAPEELPGAVPVEIPVDLPEDAPEDLPQEPEIAPEPGIDAASAAEPEVGPAPEVEAAPAYKVDDSVLAILREEAEREVKARRAETNISEPPPALGAAVAAAVAPVVAPVVAPAAEEARPAARRDLLPDVEEINSSLRPSEHEQDHTPADLPPPETGGGFRSGFLMVMAVAMVGAAVYLAAPALSRLVPALAEPLDSYVVLINGLRLQLDGVMRQATVALNGG